MSEWIKRVAGVALACGPAAYEAILTGRGWKAAVSAFVGCVIVHQSDKFTKRMR